MTQQATIYISQTDRERLGNLIDLVRNQGERSNLSYITKLEDELEFADVIASEEIPPDVVTMRSTVQVKDLDTEQESVYSIVFPSEADPEVGKMSVLAPLATALLGYKCGATVEFQAPGRLRRLKIMKILYQPESAGDYDL
jgi:regulator of nucleoside diphosphate kinase